MTKLLVAYLKIISYIRSLALFFFVNNLYIITIKRNNVDKMLLYSSKCRFFKKTLIIITIFNLFCLNYVCIITNLDVWRDGLNDRHTPNKKKIIKNRKLPFVLIAYNAWYSIRNAKIEYNIVLFNFTRQLFYKPFKGSQW